MALTQRIIAKILIDGSGTAVKFRRFTENRRIVGNPISTVRAMSDQVLDEFYFCFLGPVDTALVEKMTAEVFTPVTVAGSIRTMEQVDKLIRKCGADKVVVKDIALGESVAKKYGSQAVVFADDYHGVQRRDVPDFYGEAILTSIDRDGMFTGFDLDALLAPWRVPVVIAGGCGKLSHVKAAFAAGASGVAVASMFAFTDKSPIKLRSWLVSEGANVRAA